MLSASGIFVVQHAGPVTVVGFGRDGMPNHFYHPEFREDLLDIIETHGPQELVFDLAGVSFLGSGLIGLLASLRKEGVEISVRNAPAHLAAALEAMQLDWLHRDGARRPAEVLCRVG